MKDTKHEIFEAELAKLNPAAPPRALLDRLANSLPGHEESKLSSERPREHVFGWTLLLRWVAPFVGVSALLLILALRHSAVSTPGAEKPTTARTAMPSLKADKVSIDQHLVAAFDAVGRMPDGEPVRFRCRQWLDEVRWRDSSRGIVVEQQTPRLEVVPVKFETY
jgi:hypothetical protein